jgi:hypothetical protein
MLTDDHSFPNAQQSKLPGCHYFPQCRAADAVDGSHADSGSTSGRCGLGSREDMPYVYPLLTVPVCLFMTSLPSRSSSLHHLSGNLSNRFSLYHLPMNLGPASFHSLIVICTRQVAAEARYTILRSKSATTCASRSLPGFGPSIQAATFVSLPPFAFNF